MTTVLVTGPIGGGKSAACRHLASLGWPVYDCDSRCKALYSEVPGLRERIEKELGIPFSELGRIFTDPLLRERLESIVYPLLAEDISRWKASLDSPLAFIESAVALQKPQFDAFYDKVLLISAPLPLRESRNAAAAVRSRLQRFPRSRVDRTVRNTSTLESLYKKIDKYIESL